MDHSNKLSIEYQRIEDNIWVMKAPGSLYVDTRTFIDLLSHGPWIVFFKGVSNNNPPCYGLHFIINSQPEYEVRIVDEI